MNKQQVMTEQWVDLIREILTPKMRSEWGWCKKDKDGSVLRNFPNTTVQSPPPLSVARILHPDLSKAYYGSAIIELDFKNGNVRFSAIDQKTPAEENWIIFPDEDWWVKARSIDWPIWTVEGPDRCGYCDNVFLEAENHERACRHHPQFYFPYDIDKAGKHQKGWQCCGSTNKYNPGCTRTKHRYDIKKQYEYMSIAYRYVSFDVREEVRRVKEREALSKSREKALKAQDANPDKAAFKMKITDYIGKSLSLFIDEFGKPYDEKTIYNGSSGRVCKSKKLFYREYGLFWMVETDDNVSSFQWLEDEINIQSIEWFADESHQNAYNRNVVTNLLSD